MLSCIHQGPRLAARSVGGRKALGGAHFLARRLSTHDARYAPTSETVAEPSAPSFAWSPPPLTQAEDEFWRAIPLWSEVSSADFLSWRWSIGNVVETKRRLLNFLEAVVPAEVPRDNAFGGIQSRDEFMADVCRGIDKSAMSVRMMPYVLSRINWQDPANDPIFRQFLMLESVMIDDHPKLRLDPLDEQKDEPVPNLVHRYPDKALFLATSVCPTNCVFCTRSYGVGASTQLVTKKSFTLSRAKMEAVFKYIESQEGLHDIVVSGGDSYYLSPNILEWIGDRLIGMKNIERFRIASKGLAIAPSRFLDKADPWTDALVRVAEKARRAGKHMALHTHFNHPNEISWITERASLRLQQSGVMVRNQTVLLRGVNDNVDTMLSLIRKLAKMAIHPYYVYQCDMVPAVEHLRTPLQTILDIEAQLQGEIAGFDIPKFVVDLPGGGGKRPAYLHESYDRETGVSTFTQPALKGRSKEGRTYRYYDPVKPRQDSAV
ncbi:kama family protein [Durotheca rogersii]|uniref:kama family protein n=1 Tax=Durotheca rogersii TaxID=419775 RepID=UPI0022209DA9|nr:kama family protein [Durotheca rogersii]KAI5865004.1 kama family protein [Durotheca rogersii]